MIGGIASPNTLKLISDAIYLPNPCIKPGKVGFDDHLILDSLQNGVIIILG